MRIKVLQHHIDEGVRRNAFHCAIALAVREQTGELNVSVGDTVHINGTAFPLPHEAKSFVCCFDRGCEEHIKPFTFDLIGWVG